MNIFVFIDINCCEISACERGHKVPVSLFITGNSALAKKKKISANFNPGQYSNILFVIFRVRENLQKKKLLENQFHLCNVRHRQFIILIATRKGKKGGHETTIFLSYPYFVPGDGGGGEGEQ